MAGMRLRSIAADGALPDSADGRLQRFLDYWRSKCQADRLPHRRDIDPTEIIPLLAAIFLMDVEAGDFRFRLVGQDIVTRYGALTGRQLGGMPAGNALADTLAQHRLCGQPPRRGE